MQINKKIKEFILKNLVQEKNRKIGIEIETFYADQQLNRIPVNPSNQFSSIDFLHQIKRQNQNNKVSYSLEPGGQLEWASSPTISLWDLQSEFEEHLSYENKIIKEQNIVKLETSVDPLNSIEKIAIINSPKYQLMEKFLNNYGDLSSWMMKNTTSIQINIDYCSEQDANEMAYIADNIQPLFSILFSNAPFINGEMAKEKNLRWEIWENTDPNRCGSLFSHNIKKMESFVDDYINWIINQPAMFNINDQGKYIKSKGALKDMLNANNDIDSQIDIVLHQSFTNVRLKPFLEIRSADRQLKGDEIIPTAFMVGLLCAPETRNKTIEMINSWSELDKSILIESAFSVSFASNGPKGKMIGEYLEKISELAIEGLEERSKKFKIKNEKPFLEKFLHDILSNGTKTTQIQNKYHKTNLSLKSFIKENLTY
tara:strand:- start:1554 stop:2834 length:1281 start_codon:yes stop_codon:yes gene_type:complete